MCAFVKLMLKRPLTCIDVTTKDLNDELRALAAGRYPAAARNSLAPAAGTERADAARMTAGSGGAVAFFDATREVATSTAPQPAADAAAEADEQLLDAGADGEVFVDGAHAQMGDYDDFAAGQ